MGQFWAFLSHLNTLAGPTIMLLYPFGEFGNIRNNTLVHDMAQFWAFLSHFNTLAGPTIMLLYPLYASVCAIESPSKVDDEQWLAYWILYSFLTLTEMVAEPILYWIPIWYQLKVAFVAWLVLPQFRGAAFVYERFVREQLRKYHKTKEGGGKVESNSPNKYKEKFVSFVTPKKGEQEVY